MSDLSPETRRLIEMAREGDPIPSGRRALIESKLFTRVAGGALVGLAAREAWAKSTGLFGPLAKGIMSFAIVASVGASGYFAMRASGDSAITHSSSGTSPKTTARPAEMAEAIVAPPRQAAPPVTPTVRSIEPASAAAISSPPPRDPTTRHVASTVAKASGASARSAGSGQRAQTSASRNAATTTPQPAQQAQTAQNAPAPEQPAAQPPEEATPTRPTSTLADETRLLWEADQALRSGKTSRAVTLLDEHMTRYPEGALGPERGAERVVALCKLGRIDAAAVRGYLTSHPNLALSDRIQQTCAPILSRGK